MEDEEFSDWHDRPLIHYKQKQKTETKIEEAEKPKTWKTVLRWIGFFPASLLAAVVVWNIVSFVNRITMSFIGIDPDSFSSLLFIKIISYIAMVMAFIFTGAHIAPCHKKIIAYIHCTIAILFSGFVATPIILMGKWILIIDALAIAGSACIIAYEISENRIDVENNNN